MPLGQIGPDIERLRRDPSSLPCLTKTLCNAHEYRCSREYNCRQAKPRTTPVVVRCNARGVATLAQRIEEVLSRGSLSARGWAKKARLNETTINTFLTRNREFLEGKRAAAPTIRSLAIRRLASVAGVTPEWLLGGETVGLEVPFSDLLAWVQETKALSKLVMWKGRDVTIGDLLRYRATPSSAGQYEADEVWDHMLMLRTGIDADAGTDVTPEQAAAVPAMSPRRKKRQ